MITIQERTKILNYLFAQLKYAEKQSKQKRILVEDFSFWNGEICAINQIINTITSILNADVKDKTK